MSGITGIWHLDGAPLDRVLLERMSTTLRHRGPDGDGCRVDGPAGLACQHRWVTAEEEGESQPLVGRSGSMMVWDGRLDNRPELLRALGMTAEVSDAALALCGYERWGGDFVRRLNGDFALAVFDERLQRLVLARDAMGIRPLYYHHRPGSMVAFGSEIKAVLAVPGMRAEPDLDGLADYLLLGQRPLDRQDITCVAGVRALPPAHLALITPHHITVSRYWDFDTGRSIALRDYGEYVEAFGAHFAEAVRRRSRSRWPVGISVSGGLDSSSILCQIEADRRRGLAACPGIAGVSYTGPSGSDADEQRYVRDIEIEYGVDIDRIPLGSFEGLVYGAEEQVRAIEAPLMDFMWGSTEATMESMRNGGARVVLTGHWGDQMLFSSSYLVDLARDFRWRTVWGHTAGFARFGLGGAGWWRRRLLFDLVRDFTPERLVPPLKRLRRLFPGAARPRPWLSAPFRKLALRDANRPATLGHGFHSATARAVYLQARSKYHVHCMEVNNKAAAHFGMDMAFPFLDRDLISFLMATPGGMQCRDGVPRSLLRDAMSGILPETVRARTWKADFTAVTNQAVAGDMEQIAKRLLEASLGVRAGILDGAALAREVPRLVEGLTGPHAVDSWVLAELFGLETWLRVFLGAVPEPTLAGRTA